MRDAAASAAPDLLRVEGLTVRYGAGPVVHGITLGVPAASVAALLGANGAGKSSTLRAIAGLEPAQGSVRFDGQDISRLSAAQRFRAGIVYVPEGRAIVTDLSVTENLTLGSYFVDARTREQRRQMVLDFFPEIANRLTGCSRPLARGSGVGFVYVANRAVLHAGNLPHQSGDLASAPAASDQTDVDTLIRANHS